MSEDTVPFPEIDTSANQLICFFGRKGSGKSVGARTLFRHWPNVDKIVIDVNGDADPGPGAERITGEPPKRMPERKDDGLPLTLHYVADPGRATYRDDLDRAVGMALFPRDRRTLTWVDEVGELTPPGKTGPNTRVFVQQSRHFNASGLFCGPRPISIEPLVPQQADRIFLYDLPNPRDRERITALIGWPPAAFEDAMREVRHLNATVEPYHFLQYVAKEHQLYVCPPMPREWTGE